MVYYISDLHLFHKNIIRICNRPFKSIEDMNNTIIKNWNERISDKDIIYILGDIAYPRNVNDVFKVVEVVKSLKGHKILIQGNHDWRLVKYKEFCDLFQEITIYKEITDDNHRVILFHYPIGDWNYKYYGALHVHGHIHNNKAFNIYIIIDSMLVLMLTNFVL